MRKRAGTTTGTATPGTPAGQPSFTQAQEVQDFQVFSALTGAQQASDLNFLSEVASLFSGGSSTGGTSTPTSTPAGTAPANTGTAPPTTTAQSAAAAPQPAS